MVMDRANIHPGRCYRDTFGAVYKVEGYDGNEVRYAVYDLTHAGKLTEWAARGRGWIVRQNLPFPAHSLHTGQLYIHPLPHP
jgi:hypothetical protein